MRNTIRPAAYEPARLDQIAKLEAELADVNAALAALLEAPPVSTLLRIPNEALAAAENDDTEGDWDGDCDCCAPYHREIHRPVRRAEVIDLAAYRQRKARPQS